MLLSIVIPLYNEEKNLEKNLESYLVYLKNQQYDYEIILVDDGSFDNTKTIANKFVENNNKIKLISYDENKGKGSAVCTGLSRAKGDYSLFIDADGATSINHVDFIWKAFKEGAQIVIGSRNNKDAEGAKQIKKQALWKRVLGILGNKLIQSLAVPGINDTQCGFKAFTQKAAKTIVPKVTIDRWGFDVEMLSIARLHDLEIKTVPVLWKNSNESRVGIKGYFITLFELMKIKNNLLLKKYK